MAFSSDNLYSIVTLDNDSNILIGNLKVLDVENLKLLRECLIRYHKFNYSESVKNCYAVENIKLSTFVSDNKIKHNTDLCQLGDGVINYSQITYGYKHLGLLNLFNSLLGSMDDLKLDYISELFVNNGIFKVLPMDKVWLPFAYEVNDKTNNGNSFDLMLFQDTLFGTKNSKPMLQYNVQEIIPLEEYKDNDLLRKRNILFQDVCTNGLVLGTYTRKRRKIN